MSSAYVSSRYSNSRKVGNSGTRSYVDSSISKKTTSNDKSFIEKIWSTIRSSKPSVHQDDQPINLDKKYNDSYFLTDMQKQRLRNKQPLQQPSEPPNQPPLSARSGSKALSSAKMEMPDPAATTNSNSRASSSIYRTIGEETSSRQQQLLLSRGSSGNHLLPATSATGATASNNSNHYSNSHGLAYRRQPQLPISPRSAGNGHSSSYSYSQATSESSGSGSSTDQTQAQAMHAHPRSLGIASSSSSSSSAGFHLPQLLGPANLLLGNHNKTISSSSNNNKQQQPSSNTASSSTSSAVLCCDKCDGRHLTEACPYYRKQRDDHPDAQRRLLLKDRNHSLLPGAQLSAYSTRVVRQPGDGSCLFHSLAYGLGQGYTAQRLRNELCAFMSQHPRLLISETPLADWVTWDSGGSSVQDYARRMSRGGWGGGLELAVCSAMMQVNVHVYERHGSSGSFKRISAFDCPKQPELRPTIRVLYCGGVHYDAIAS